MTDVTANLLLPADPAPDARTSITVPATPVSAAYDVSDIPTITLPLTKNTKAHVAGVIAAVSGAGQIALQILPVGHVTEYLAAGLAVLTIGATWLGVYSAPNIPKITKK